MQICNDKKICTGCGLCTTVCPKNCIEMVPNTEGFLYPFVNEIECISCHKCVNKCPINNTQLNKNLKNEKVCYAFQNQDSTVLQESSSGGFFSAAAKCILNDGGVVYAAEMDGLSRVRHFRIDSEKMLYKGRKSKYIQSEAWGVYKSMLSDLRTGKEVLFVGTPCQVAAVKALSNSKNLYTIDLVCHGVANEKTLLKYLQSIRDKYEKEIKKMYFRHKMNVGGVIMRIQFEDNTEYTANSSEDLFMRGFNGNLFLRRSCYSCYFAGDSRVGDITIGDFWGLGVLKDTQIDVINGVNFVKTNTPQGERLLKNIIETQDVILEEHNILEAKLRNRTLTKPMKMPKNREKYFDLMESENFEYLISSLISRHNIERNLFDYRDRAIKKIRRTLKSFKE